MSIPIWKVYVDWNNDGDFIDAGEDITAYVQSLSWRYGRDHASSLTGEVSSLSFNIELLNTDGRFNSFVASGPYYGNLLPGRRIKAEATYGGTTYPLFAGFIDKIQPAPDVGGNHLATISGYGPIAWISRQSISIGLQQDKDTGTLVGAVLDKTGWSAGDRTIDSGYTIVPYYFIDDKRDALNLIRELERSEGGYVYETRDGKIGFANRYRRVIAPYNTSQATFSDAPGATIGYETISQLDSNAEIYNKVSATVAPLSVKALAVLWTLSETGVSAPVIAPGDSLDIWASVDGATVSAVLSWTTPAAGVDFTANSVSDGSGTDLTSDITVATSKFSGSMKITLTNNGAANACITLLQARGVALAKSDSTTVQSEDAASQAKYGIREYPLDAPWLPDSTVAQNYCDATVDDCKDPSPIIPIAFTASKSALMETEALTRYFSDRITLVGNGSALLGISGEMFVEATEHNVSQGGTLHRTKYELSSAAIAEAVWILGQSQLGTDTILAAGW